MFNFTQASAVRAGIAAAAIALFASHAAMATPTAFAGHPKEISYWADAQSVSRGGNNDTGATPKSRVASRAGNNDTGANAHEQLASRAGPNDTGATPKA